MSRQKYEKRLRNTGRSTGSTQDMEKRPRAHRDGHPPMSRDRTEVGNVHRQWSKRFQNCCCPGGKETLKAREGGSHNWDYPTNTLRSTRTARSRSRSWSGDTQRGTQTTTQKMHKKEELTNRELYTQQERSEGKSPQATTDWLRETRRSSLRGRGGPCSGHLPPVRGSEPPDTAPTHLQLRRVGTAPSCGGLTAGTCLRSSKGPSGAPIQVCPRPGHQCLRTPTPTPTGKGSQKHLVLPQEGKDRGRKQAARRCPWLRSPHRHLSGADSN